MKFSWLAAAVVLAGWFVARRHKQARWFQVAELVAIVAAVLIGTGVIHLPNFEKLLEDAGQALGKWTYLVVGLLAFAETGAFLGFIAPGETAVLVGGLVAGQKQISLIVLIAIVWACAVGGDVTSFTLGRRLGRAWLLRHGERLKITEERLDQVEGFFEKRGGATILIGRFLGFVRPLLPFTAGASKMPLRRFLPYDVLAAGLLGTVLCLVGYLFWHSLDTVLAIAKKGTLALGATIVVVAALVAAVRWLHVAENRRRIGGWLAEHERTPVLGAAIRLARAVGRRLAGPARFAWERLTPGQLGLQLTSLLAVASVGSFVFFGYMIALHPIARVTAGDARALRWATDLEAPWLTHAAKIVTVFGSLPLAGGALALTALVLLARRHRLEGIALLAGFAVTYAGVHIAKAALARPRPPDPLVHANGFAYPSAHAAYATCWVAIAVALRHAFPSLAARAAILVVGIALAVAVGLTRIYLRVHWFSDVAGGWGLGATAFALAGTVALVVAFVRDERRGLSDR